MKMNQIQRKKERWMDGWMDAASRVVHYYWDLSQSELKMHIIHYVFQWNTARGVVAQHPSSPGANYYYFHLRGIFC